jgi:hypothetical protein
MVASVDSRVAGLHGAPTRGGRGGRSTLEDPGGQGGKLQEEDNAIPKIENKEQCGRMTSGI